MLTDVPWRYGNYSRRDRSKRTRTKLLPSSSPVRQPLSVESESTVIRPNYPVLSNPLIVVSDFLGERFSLTKFPFGCEPKLNISSGWSAVFFPDFTRPFADLIFVRTGQS